LEPVTHLLTGACLSRLGFNRRSALATATMVLAAEIPDLDVLWYFDDSASGFAHHRGFTHTLLGVPADAAVALGIVAIYWFLRGKKVAAKKHHGDAVSPWQRPRWGLLFCFACIAALSHIALDFTNNYGVRPFAPFSWRWYSWDIVFIVEPLLLAALIIGLIAPALFGLVNQEISSRRSARIPGGRGGAIFALVFMLALWGFRDLQHRRALAALSSFDYQREEPVRLSAYPYWINPFEWHGVVETRDFFALVPVNSANGEVDPQGRMRIRYKPEETAVTLAAKRSYLGRAYLSWAQYPLVEVEQRSDLRDMYIVHFFDLRFAYPDRPGRPLGAVVELDANLNPVAQYFESRHPRHD
jgi:inner membrane protein